jgi:23S rRNA pseudouridine2605 synthase
MQEIRLQKFFTDCGVLSRRAAEAEINAGRVKVNGNVAFIGQKIDPEKDKVFFNGKQVLMPKKHHFIYVMLNKPRGYLTSMSDDRGRKCVTELVSEIEERIYPVGRLDMDSEGLLLLTNDGALTNKLTHPRHEIPKIYNVKIKGTPTEDQLRALRSPMKIDDYDLAPVKIDLVSIKEDYSVLQMTLYEGRNRQIRKMCERVELEILRLQRIAIGELKLGNLSPGKWRYLTKSQVEYLKNPKPSKNQSKGRN